METNTETRPEGSTSGGGGSRVRVYVASSLDGFIAGPDDDLSWLDGADAEGDEDEGWLTYEVFIRDVGALLMGRRTYEVVRGFGGEWPYGDRPVLVASRRDLDERAPSPVRRVEGSIDSLVRRAKDAAAGRDVYVDGGEMIRQACQADLVDELTVTLAPVALGAGLPLFAGMTERYRMELAGFSRSPGGMVQLRLVPATGTARTPRSGGSR